MRIDAANVTREDVEPDRESDEFRLTLSGVGEDTLVLGVHDLPSKPPLIIGIHGLSNKPPKEVLEHQWLTAIADGLTKYPVKTVEFRLAYWADLRYPEPVATWTPELSYESPGPAYQPRRLDGLRKGTTAVLVSGWDRVRRLVPNSLRLRLMNRYLRDQVPDLIAYWLRPKIREAIGSRLRDLLEPGRKTLIIGHSMGSIVAYDVLQSSEVDALITIGSPLGLPSVWQHFPAQARGFPSLRRWWRNFSDPGDYVAAIPWISGADSRLIRSTYGCHAGNHNPHKSFGYLRSPEVAEAIWDFLKSEDLTVC